MYIIKCDGPGCVAQHLCDRGADVVVPNTWYVLFFGKGTGIRFQLCPGCRKKLGIPELVNERDVGGRLVEILTEIARDEAEDAIANH